MLNKAELKIPTSNFLEIRGKMVSPAIGHFCPILNGSTYEKLIF